MNKLIADKVKSNEKSRQRRKRRRSNGKSGKGSLQGSMEFHANRQRDLPENRLNISEKNLTKKQIANKKRNERRSMLRRHNEVTLVGEGSSQGSKHADLSRNLSSSCSLQISIASGDSNPGMRNKTSNFWCALCNVLVILVLEICLLVQMPLEKISSDHSRHE